MKHPLKFPFSTTTCSDPVCFQTLKPASYSFEHPLHVERAPPAQANRGATATRGLSAEEDPSHLSATQPTCS